MNNEVLPPIPEKTWETFAKFDNDCIVEVFGLWDCYKQDWNDRTTRVFRFESNDIFTWLTNDGLQTRLGAVDTTAVNEGIYDALSSNNETSCFCWVPDNRYKHLLGKDHQGRNLLLAFQ